MQAIFIGVEQKSIQNHSLTIDGAEDRELTRLLSKKLRISESGNLIGGEDEKKKTNKMRFFKNDAFTHAV